MINVGCNGKSERLNIKSFIRHIASVININVCKLKL